MLRGLRATARRRYPGFILGTKEMTILKVLTHRLLHCFTYLLGGPPQDCYTKDEINILYASVFSAAIVALFDDPIEERRADELIQSLMPALPLAASGANVPRKDFASWQGGVCRLLLIEIAKTEDRSRLAKLAETVGGFRRLASIESHSREMEARAQNAKE